MIKVVVVDDSAFIRQFLTEVLNSDEGVEVVAAAPDPFIAREMIKKHNPDVITLDIEMPKMDGLSFLEKIMRLRPMPVVMISSLTQEGADATLQALELGAVDFVAKPKIDLREGLKSLRQEIIDKVKVAARARVKPLVVSTAKPVAGLGVGVKSTEKIVAIGSSTGGVEALREIFAVMPADSPAILITQHMPLQFTAAFAARLDRLSAMHVEEAKDGVRVLPGHAYIAPGDKHLRLKKYGANFVCQLTDDDPVSGHKPSVDVLFESVARLSGNNAIGVILTGMGKDGAEGLLKIRGAGGKTFGQDEKSCLVYGMPKAAFEIGAVEEEFPLHKIAEKILEACRKDGEMAIRV